MEYYPDTEGSSITDKLDVLIRGMDAALALSYSHCHAILTPGKHGYSMGKKYTRVYEDMDNGQRVVRFFVENEHGTVWKAAGWKGPTLNFPRGNINTAEGRWALTGGKIGESGYYYAGM